VLYGYKILSVACPELVTRNLRGPAACPTETIGNPSDRIIPFDYVSKFRLTGRVGHLLEDEVPINVEGGFVATAVGYGMTVENDRVAIADAARQTGGSVIVPSDPFNLNYRAEIGELGIVWDDASCRRILANLTRSLLTLPFALTGVQDDLVRNPGASRAGGFVQTAVDNMSPGHPFILGLQVIPVVPSVKVNSIIAVEGDGPFDQGDDGVVKYSAAHIEPVESELIVKSGHSVQGNPLAIEEVRRILRLHGGLK
jgi:hypothetical protein